MKPTEREITILRAFAVSGAMTVREVECATRLDGLNADCERLYGNGLLNRDHGKEPIYTVSYKGRNAIGKSKAPMGEMPESRRGLAPSDPYVPEPIFTRPGSQDHLACKSRRGSELVEHRPPISMGAA